MSIYLQHFGLKREPFSIVPDPGFLYPSNHHRQAVAHLKYGLDREGGFILLTGEVGTGKTTLTRTLLTRLPAHIRVAYVLNSKLEVTDVLASICDELAIDLTDIRGLSFSKICIDALNQDLITSHAEGQKTLIVIEEAQNLTPDVLEMLRLLSNLETNTQKLLYILLVGQPELLDILALKDLRQLNQRVVSRFHLLPLEKKDLANYVNHRLHRAGGQQPLFNSASISMLFRKTQGVPRLVNLVCQHALVAAYSLGAKTVSPALVKTAAREVLGSGKIIKTDRWRFAVMAALLFVIGGLIMHFVDSPDISTPRTNTPQLLLESVERLDSEPINNPKPQDSIANPFVALLGRWSIDIGQLYSEDAFFAQAAHQNLRAFKMTAGTVEALRRVDRPGIVWLKEESLLRVYLLTGISQSKVILTGSQGISSIDLLLFTERWTGNFLYLWQPPQGFKPLKIGSKNPQLVSWLQDQLAIIDQTAERLVTGGLYTKAIANKVRDFQSEQALKSDAIVGRETIMRLNQLTNDSVPRLDKGDQ